MSAAIPDHVALPVELIREKLARDKGHFGPHAGSPTLVMPVKQVSREELAEMYPEKESKP